MNKTEIMKELDKFEIPYETDANKPVLQKLLDDELAKRASGDDTDPETPETVKPVESDEPEMSDEERAAKLTEAEDYLAECLEAQTDIQARIVKVRKAIASLTPKRRQLSLAECVAGLHQSVKNDMAVKAEVQKITARNLSEAEALLETDEAEE